MKQGDVYSWKYGSEVCIIHVIKNEDNTMSLITLLHKNRRNVVMSSGWGAFRKGWLPLEFTE